MEPLRFCVECKNVVFGQFCGSCGGETVRAHFKCPYCKFTDSRVSVMDKFCETCGRPIQEEVRLFIEQEKREAESKKEGGDSNEDRSRTT